MDIHTNLLLQHANLRATSNRESPTNANRTVAASNREPFLFCHHSCVAPHRGPTPLEIPAGHLLARGIYTALQLADPSVRFPFSRSPTPSQDGRLSTPRADSHKAPPGYVSSSRAFRLSSAEHLPTPDVDSNEVPVDSTFLPQVPNE